MNLDDREVHGAIPEAGLAERPMIVRETDDQVVIHHGFSEIKLGARSARFLARKLNRLALRIEKRAELSWMDAIAPDRSPKGRDVGLGGNRESRIRPNPHRETPSD